MFFRIINQPFYTYHAKNEKRQAIFHRLSPIFQKRRNEATRTPDPYVPNVVRYQLRYIPSLITLRRYCKNSKNEKFCSFFIKHLHKPKSCPIFALANKTVPQLSWQSKGLKILVSPVRFLVAPLARNANDLQNKLLAFFLLPQNLIFGYILTTF